jgi:hypothetical protein
LVAARDERRGEAWLTLERDGADPQLTGEGGSGSASIKTSGEGRSVRRLRDLTSCWCGRGGCEGARLRQMPRKIEEWGTDGFTSARARGGAGEGKLGGGGWGSAPRGGENGGGVWLGPRVGW